MKSDGLMAALRLILKLEHIKGRRIFLLIDKNPGIRFKEIREITGYDSNDVSHALIKLRGLGLIVSNDGHELTEMGNRTIDVLERLKGDAKINLLMEEMKRRS